VARHGLLEVAGVMGVAPVGGDPGEAFGRLQQVAAEVRARHPGATMVSAGMSGDLEAAVRCGATHVRVGSAVLGERPTNG
jgi:PLP dependent protein